MNKRIVVRVILPILIVVEICFLFLTFKSFFNRNIDEIKEIYEVDKKMFAMYVQNDSGQYEEVIDSSYFPSGKYKINQTKSSCVDNKGNSVSTDVMTYNGGKLTVSSNKTIFCYLYFDTKHDITVTVSTDGVSGVLPTSGIYKNTLSCDSATATYNQKYQRLEFSAVTSDEVKCNLDYTKDTTTYPTLKSIVEANATEITLTNSNSETETSHRYTGKTPNNYVWFNNELWRIIGSIPTCTSSGCATSENLVKIIRDKSIGVLTYEAKASYFTGTWESNTLYSLLNTHYYATSEDNLNGQSHAGCYGYYANNYQTQVNCDYRAIGILSNSYYGKMVKNVFWNTGASSSYSRVPSAIYTEETATQIVSGYIGLMSLSDYGFAVDSSYHSVVQADHDTREILGTNWLYVHGYEWTNIKSSAYSTDVNHVGSYISYQEANVDGPVRPVVYLDSSVFVVSGNGNITNPYMIEM